MTISGYGGGPTWYAYGTALLFLILSGSDEVKDGIWGLVICWVLVLMGTSYVIFWWTSAPFGRGPEEATPLSYTAISLITAYWAYAWVKMIWLSWPSKKT
jgi:hypothetical protein